MEFLKSLSTFIENLRVGRDSSTIWDYQEFRRYLLSLIKNQNFLLPFERYPLKIKLNQGWCALFANMAEETTSDRLERLALIGYKNDRDRIYLPSVTVLGQHNKVLPEAVTKERNIAKRKSGIIGTIGNIHTHPESSEPPSFSPADLYGMLNPDSKDLLRIVVTGESVIMAFKTKNSSGTGFSQQILSVDTFCKYWFGKYGAEYKPEEQSFVCKSADTNAWTVSLGIAERHRLVFYKGRIGKDLRRVN